ncbi:MAG: endonuclease MutS2, partial [Clostridia bacterium]|nr:endonuclease MutS2 [Clostridia bacterium]
MENANIQKLELDKILAACSSFACLQATKDALKSLSPSGDLQEVRERLSLTAECDKLLFRYGVGKVEYFPDVSALIVRASKGSALSCAELLDVNALLRSARIAYRSISGVDDNEILKIKQIAARLYFDENLENDIAEKIISAEQVSDFASDTLYSIRSKIKTLNERIRGALSEYVTGSNAAYLQDGIVTIRNDRYVIPVKAEHKGKIKGFVHDRSQSGATFFIEPEYVLNLNNELISLTIDEREEVERILKALSVRVGAMRERLEADAATLSEIDGYFARAEYAYSIKAVCPQVNKRGYINIIKGRHPLIEKDKVVPVSLELGRDYSYLLLSGANTGGKTVTLKMAGLFCLMAECGLFIPAAVGSEVCAFANVFCDLGDSQSIEESLSTFSSHMTTVAAICNAVDRDSLVLIDELGGGTNPDEGQALARAVTEYLLKAGSKGIITTHFTALKEFAYSLGGIENAAMQFDTATLKPLYSIKIGLAGASNALAVSRRLGMNPEILERAESYLSDEGRTYDNILKRAEESRLEAQEANDRAAALQAEWQAKCDEAKKLVATLEKERKSLAANVRAESRRLINERTARAEELLAEIEGIFSKEEISQTELIRARTLKNRIKDEGYEKEEVITVDGYLPADEKNIKAGAAVFVESLQSR